MDVLDRHAGVARIDLADDGPRTAVWLRVWSMEWTVNLEFSRRMVLKAGSVLGLAYLAGCQRPGYTVEPDGTEVAVPFPEPPVTPGGVIPNTGSSSPVYTNPPVVVNEPTKPVWTPPANPVTPGPVVGVLPRSRWTPQGMKRPENTRAMGGVKYITVHHDGMNAFYDMSEGGAVKRLNTIRESHTERKAKAGEKWADIGYHFIVDPAGRVWEGRPLQYQGAHVQDYNEHNIGVMCMGNFEQQSPSRAQVESLDRFVLQLMKQYRITLGNVKTHREWASTACPGRNLQSHMVQTRGRGGNIALALAGDSGLLLA